MALNHHVHATGLELTGMAMTMAGSWRECEMRRNEVMRRQGEQPVTRVKRIVSL